MLNKLTGKQQAFKEEYCRNGQNGLQAAKTAKYKGNDNVLAQMAHKLIRNSKVKIAIDQELAKIKAESIATRKLRQQFWTNVMDNTEANMADRLRASQLLGLSEADFTERHITEQPTQELAEEEQRALAELARQYKVRIAKPIIKVVRGTG